MARMASSCSATARVTRAGPSCSNGSPRGCAAPLPAARVARVPRADDAVARRRGRRAGRGRLHAHHRGAVFFGQAAMSAATCRSSSTHAAPCIRCRDPLRDGRRRRRRRARRDRALLHRPDRRRRVNHAVTAKAPASASAFSFGTPAGFRSGRISQHIAHFRLPARSANASPIISRLGSAGSSHACASPAAICASVSVSVRSRAVLHASTIATAVAGARPASISSCAMPGAVAAHVIDHRIGARGFANLVAARRAAVRRERDAARHAAQRQRTLQRRRPGQRRGDARHDLVVDAGRFQRAHLLFGATEQHRVATLQPHDARMLACRIDDLLVDEVLRGRALPQRLPTAIRRACGA